MPTCRMLLLRHGQSTWNADGRWQGWADPPLSPLGEAQADGAVEGLRLLGFVAVAASDLQRARSTAERVAAGLGLAPVEVVPDLRERDVGSYSGLTREQIVARWPERLDPATDRILPPADAEAEEQVVARARRGLRGLAQRVGSGPVLVVTHGGVLRFLERSLGLEPDRRGTANLTGRWFHVEPCADSLFPGEALAPVPEELATRPPAR